jgi:hypothetical protein
MILIVSGLKLKVRSGWSFCIRFQFKLLLFCEATNKGSKRTTMTEYYAKMDPTTLHYKKITKSKKGSNVVYIARSVNQDHNAKVQLNLPDDPKLTCPFGLCTYDEESGGRLTLDISLEQVELVNWGKALDKNNVDVAIANKDEWFKPGTTEDQVRNMYYPCLQFDQSTKGYAPKLHCKANTQPGNRQLRVLNMNVDGKTWTPGEIDDLKTKFVKVIAIIEIGNVWFQKLQFGMTLLVTDVIIFSEENRQEFDFVWGGASVPMKAGEEKVECAAVIGASVEQVLTEDIKLSSSILLEVHQEDERATKRQKK